MPKAFSKPHQSFLIFLGLFFSVNSLCLGQESSTYYKITHPETGSISFLLGTYHYYPKGWFEVPEKVKNDLKKTNGLITEIGILDSMKIKTKLVQLTRYKGEKTIFDYMKKWQKEPFNQYLQDKIGGSETTKSEVIKYKPYFMISRLFALRFSDSIMNMESELKAIAFQNGQQILGLEPDEKRLLRYSKKYGKKTKTANLELTIEPMLLSSALMFHKYLNGDLESIQIFAGNASEIAIERNLYWLPLLEEKLKESFFIAVGAGHLIGEKSIQNLLKQKGFLVQAIPLSLPIPEDLSVLLSDKD